MVLQRVDDFMLQVTIDRVRDCPNRRCGVGDKDEQGVGAADLTETASICSWNTTMSTPNPMDRIEIPYCRYGSIDGPGHFEFQDCSHRTLPATLRTLHGAGPDDSIPNGTYGCWST